MRSIVLLLGGACAIVPDSCPSNTALIERLTGSSSSCAYSDAPTLCSADLDLNVCLTHRGQMTSTCAQGGRSTIPLLLTRSSFTLRSRRLCRSTSCISSTLCRVRPCAPPSWCVNGLSHRLSDSQVARPTATICQQLRGVRVTRE